ncbi:YkvA family protein [Methanobacterium aggregans]|uniref:YkvA family protein n=1 Tax=Methanobacterium aggregans TaxID=1615586 RepID=UPI001AE6B943|nr:YkvA family protein [Methanobacterium aggregans]MBP2045891.1 uncharacterized membrane protein YkvA (DUF1232 family) [Methanobacterium aggregans]
MCIIWGKNWREDFEKLKYETYALYLSYKDPKVPLYLKILIILFLGYILSPIDLIPDFIPVLGYLDDFILVTIGIPMLMKRIPEEILKEHEQEARLKFNGNTPKSWYVDFIVILIWILIIIIILKVILTLY